MELSPDEHGERERCKHARERYENMKVAFKETAYDILHDMDCECFLLVSVSNHRQ